MTLNRRQFIAAGASTFMLPTLTRAAGAAAAPRDGFSFIVLGDLHYDRPEHHDMKWLETGHKGDVNQVKGYCKTTAEFTPKLLAEVASHIAAGSPAETARTSAASSAGGSPRQAGGYVKPLFVLQVGDLVEGLCGSPDLATLQCRDALTAVKQAKLGAPFLIIKGNHDVTGPGAVEAFNQQVLPFVAEQAKSDVHAANYTLELGGQWFVFFDAYDKGSLAWLEQVTSKQQDRPMFFVVHPPVVPYNARATWHLFAKPSEAPQRERLLAILGRHRAIALTGHLHKYAAMGRRTSGGTFSQLAVCSVLRSAAEQPKDVASGLGEYNGNLIRFEPSHSPETAEQRRAILDGEKPTITSFDFADLPGYAIVHVGKDGRTTADIYAGLGKKLWKTVDLTPPAA
jgi:hypothetical protein